MGAIKVIYYGNDAKVVARFVKSIRGSADLFTRFARIENSGDFGAIIKYEVIITAEQDVILAIYVYSHNLPDDVVFLISIDLDALADPSKNADIAEVFEADYAVPLAVLLSDFIKAVKARKTWSTIVKRFKKRGNYEYAFRLKNLLTYIKLMLAIVRKSKEDVVNVLRGINNRKYQLFEDFAKNNAFVGIFSDDPKLSTLIALLHTRINIDVGRIEELLGCDDRCLIGLLKNINNDDQMVSIRAKLLELQLRSRVSIPL